MSLLKKHNLQGLIYTPIMTSTGFCSFQQNDTVRAPPIWGHLCSTLTHIEMGGACFMMLCLCMLYVILMLLKSYSMSRWKFFLKKENLLLFSNKSILVGRLNFFNWFNCFWLRQGFCTFLLHFFKMLRSAICYLTFSKIKCSSKTPSHLWKRSFSFVYFSCLISFNSL